MNKQLPLILLLSFFTAALSGQVERMVLIEEFTNASCGPCEDQNPEFNALLNANLDKVVPIKFQTEFPGFDPYNEDNPNEVAARRALYPEVTGVPTAAIDGQVPTNDYGGGGLATWIDNQGNGYNGGPYGYNQAVLDYAASVPTTIGIEINATIPDFTATDTITIDITNVDTAAFTANANLFVALVELENKWPEPPGATSEAEFTHVMRKMFPNANGTSIGTIPGDTTISIELEVNIPSYIYDLSQLAFVGFIQNQTDRSVVNATITDPLPVPSIYPSLTFGDDNSNVGGSLCERTYTPSIEVINNGSVDVTEFNFILDNNGEQTVVPVTDTLFIDSTTSLSLDAIDLPAGLSNFRYAINNVNGQGGTRLVNTLESISETTSVPAAEQTTETEISYGFEEDVNFTETPNGMILNNPSDFMRIVSSQNLPMPTGPVGGYGESDQSLFVNFWQWNPQASPPNRGDMVLAREFSIDPEASELLISFDRAHAQFNQSNDGLEGYISYDCGENWTRVYSKSGSTLSTTNPSGSFFTVGPDQWETDSITIELDGTQSSALFKFEAISTFGNGLYLDNIKAEGVTVVSSVDPVIFDQNPTVYPNPSAGQSTLAFQVREQKQMNITLYNAMGQATHTIADRVFAAGSYRMPLSLGQNSNGMYRIVFTTDEGVQAIPFILTR
jgi:hypothetical protein